MTKIFCDLTRKFVGLDIKNSVLTTKMRVFDHKNMYLTMKLEPVLTTKIVDNFVRFGMPYSWNANIYPRLPKVVASFPGLQSPNAVEGLDRLWR